MINEKDKLFERYNPSSEVKECPQRQKNFRDELGDYALMAVNLYGVIDVAEFTKIFNVYHDVDIETAGVRTLLLPLVLEEDKYCFSKIT